MLTIAIFADLHGRIELCFRLCARWQRETGGQLDYILQAGDLGAFFDRNRLDRATIRFAQNDPTELGFLEDFTQPNPRTAAALAGTGCPLLFVRGNHEDHTALDELERQHAGPLFPVDAYGRLLCIKTGVPFELRGGDAVLRVLGIGRVAPIDGETDTEQPRYIQPEEEERIYRIGQQPVDLLLTHDSARHFVTRGYGMEAISDVLAGYRPAYHIHGHVGGPSWRRPADNGATEVVKLADLSWERGGTLLPDGCMAILTWRGPNDHQLDVVDAPWLKEYSRHGWRYL
ncbi:MAG TPA: metallophosphoesterase [Roseiflexaceae bacterium]|nr:metallophosphoesterase [Roseiflexaceae bacterium]